MKCHNRLRVACGAHHRRAMVRGSASVVVLISRDLYQMGRGCHDYQGHQCLYPVQLPWLPVETESKLHGANNEIMFNNVFFIIEFL